MIDILIKQLIFYRLPILTFVIVAILTFILVLLWNLYLSPRTRATRRRIQNLADSKSNLSDNQSLNLSDGSGHSFQFLERIPGFNQIELLLLRSGSSKTPYQIISFCLILALMSMILLPVLVIDGFIIIPITIFIATLPILKALRDQDRRFAKFEEQLPDALDFLSRALLSGHGISYAFSMVGEEFPDPLGREFKLAADQINYGLPFNDAMMGLTNRILSPDLNFFVVCLLIQRDTGGNLAELLQTISSTIRERLKFKEKIRVLSSESKLSGLLLTALPFFIAGIITLINYDYISQLWTTEMGKKMLTASAIMIPIGTLWMQKITRIKV